MSSTSTELTYILIVCAVRIDVDVSCCSAGIFKQSMGAIGTQEEKAYRTRPPGYIGWRN